MRATFFKLGDNKKILALRRQNGYFLKGDKMATSKGDKMATKNELVKSHRMMRARDGLLTHQHKFLGLSVSKLDPYQDNFPPVEITYAEYCKLSGENIENKHYKRFYNVGRKALKRWIYIENEDGTEWKEWPLVKEIAGKKGKITVEFNEKLKGHFIQIQEKFSKIGLGVYFTLKKDYSAGFYEILKTREMQADKNDQFFVDLTIEEIRQKFQLGEKYAHYKDLKRRVILDSLNELSEKTDITYNRLEESGRPVEKIRIWATRKPEKRVQQIEKISDNKFIPPKEIPSFISPTFYKNMENRKDPEQTFKKKELSEKQKKVLKIAESKGRITPIMEKELIENPEKVIGKLLEKKEEKKPKTEDLKPLKTPEKTGLFKRFFK